MTHPSIEERIRLKAYYIWLNTGNPDSVANWLLAEYIITHGKLSL